MKNRKRWIYFAIALIAVLAVIRMIMSDAGIEVETIRIHRDSLQVTVTEEGKTRLQNRYTVTAPVTGRLARITLQEGDKIHEGALLARIYPLPVGSRNVTIAEAQLNAAEARKHEALARIDEARARLEQIERELDRRRTLVQDSILSQEEFERGALAATSAQRQLEAAQASLEVIEADAAAARANLMGSSSQTLSGKAISVPAPSTGRILRVFEENETIIQAGTPLLAIGNADKLEVVVDVLSEDAVQIQPSNAVIIEEWGGAPLRGSVRMIEPDAFTEIMALGVEEQRVNIIVDVSAPPSELGSGYRVEARIVTWMASDVITVPTNAFFQKDGTWHVFTVEDGQAASRPISIGHRSAEAAEVIAGLEAGDEVILYPTDQIQDGVAVQPRTP